ncbi:MAG: ComEC/Rec2 family competence protein, partial [Planctomycetota bacterium]
MDNIQRKLAAIDAQLTAGPLTSFKQISATAPLLFAATGLIAGILIQNAFSEPQVTSHAPRIIYFWLILLALSAIASVLIFTIPKAAKLGPLAIVLLSSCALICFTCLGAVRLITFSHPAPNDIRNLVTDKRTLATIRGSIVTDPYIDQRRWEFAKFLPTDPSTSFYLKLSEVETTAGWAKAAGTVRVRVDEPVLDLKTGDHIQAYCWLDTFKPPTNPGQFNFAEYLARKNIFIAASIKSREGIELLPHTSTGIFSKARTKLRQTASSTLVGHLSPEDRNRALLEALLLGYRSNIDSRTYRAFRITGLLHFISLSGMHLGILIGFVWSLCKLAGLMKRTRAIVCFIAIFIFLLIVPPRAPTVRAAIIGFVFCASLLFRRKASSLNTLSLAAIILLLIRPTQLFEAGWQLSFASVLGILLFTDRIHFFLYEKTPGLASRKKAAQTTLFLRIISKLGVYALGLFSIGLAAWLGGAGILLYHFYTINPLTCLWTIIAFPLVLLILTVGYTKIILSLLLPTIAALLGSIVSALATALIWIVERVSAIGISQILIGHIPLAPIILYYCLILFATSAFRRPRIKRAVCAAMAAALIAFLGLTKYQRTYRNHLLLTCLDVGHGQAIFAQLPGKANILFDAGSLYKSNIGHRILAPFLDYIGTNTIDAIIVSHNDVDHLNGIPE